MHKDSHAMFQSRATVLLLLLDCSLLHGSSAKECHLYFRINHRASDSFHSNTQTTKSSSQEQRFQLHCVPEFRFQWWIERAWPRSVLFPRSVEIQIHVDRSLSDLNKSSAKQTREHQNYYSLQDTALTYNPTHQWNFSSQISLQVLKRCYPCDGQILLNESKSYFFIKEAQIVSISPLIYRTCAFSIFRLISYSYNFQLCFYFLYDLFLSGLCIKGK